MKEKTFEELIEENTNWSKATLGGYEKTISTKKCLKLLQQVREATKAECEQYIEDNPEIALDFTRGREIKINLPTDRIKTEK